MNPIAEDILMHYGVKRRPGVLVKTPISMAATFWPEWKNSKPWERAKKKLPKN